MKLTTEKIGAENIDIEVNQSGEFHAEFNEEKFRATTQAELIEQLRRAVKKAKAVKPVDVTVLRLRERTTRKDWDNEIFETTEEGTLGVVDAKLRGYNERNHVFLLVDDKKQKFQLGGYKNGDAVIVRRLTAAEKRDYAVLVEAERVALTGLEDFIGLVKIDAKKTLAAAAGKDED